MKDWFRWLLPLLTIFAVLTAVVLPPQLSLFQDQALFSSIYTEELKIESTTSAQVLEQDVTQQIRSLFFYMNEGWDSIVIKRSLDETESTPEERKEVEEFLFPEIKKLKEYGLLPESFTPDYLEGEWIYLQDQTKDTGSWFLLVGLYNEEKDVLQMCLDRESKKVLWLDFFCIRDFIPGTAKDMGILFMNQLGLDYEQIYGNQNNTVFSITDTDLCYMIFLNYEELNIHPYIEGMLYDSNNRSSTGGTDKD